MTENGNTQQELKNAKAMVITRTSAKGNKYVVLEVYVPSPKGNLIKIGDKMQFLTEAEQVIIGL